MVFVYHFQFEDDGNSKLEVLELFAGVARIAKTAAHYGYTSRAYDILFDESYKKKRFRFSTHNKRKKRSFMDLNGAAGLAPLDDQCFEVFNEHTNPP